MKKVFTNWKMSLTALFLVGGLMLVSNNAQAQGNILQPNTPDVKGADSWLVESEALQTLEAQLQGPIAQSLAQLPPGGQQYIIWKTKAELYEAVHGAIASGINTSKAFRVNYDQKAGAPHLEPVISALSQSEWQAVFNELVDLLTY